MSLVLKEVFHKKTGETTSFTVVRAETGTPEQVLDGIGAGEYKIMDGSSIVTARTSYRRIQDIEIVSA